MDCKCSECMMHVDWSEDADGPTEWVPAKLLADRDAEIADLRARLDAEASHRLSLGADNERFIAEIERLRADLVWAVNNSAFVDRVGFDTPTFAYYPDESAECVFVDCDGTPDSICRAVREARDGK